MADRTVVVRLKAEIGQYQAAMVKARDGAKEFGREVSGAGKTSKADLDQIGRGATGLGVAATAAFALATNATMDFDAQLSELGAVSSATAGEMDKLRDAALDAGAKTAFSAAEAATAQTELAKAGVSTADILGGALTGALDLAAAGGLELGRAAEIAAGAMGTFDLAGTQVTHVADVLAAGANKSAADVDELAQAMAQSGLVADQYGLDLEDTVGVLSMFAQNQLKGSDAGTSFKTMLQRLTPTSKEAADQMEDLGIDFFNAKGEFIGIEEAAGVLKDRLSGLTQEQRNTAMATMFGSDAVRASTILYEEGAEGVAEWVSKVDDAGFAGEVAGKRMDNLAGDLEELRGSIETALIKGGSQGTTALRFLTQGATGAVNGFGELPGVLQATGLGLTAVAGAGGLALGAIAYVGPRLDEAKKSLDKMGSAGEFMSRNLGNIAKGMGALGAGVAVWSQWEGAMASAKARADEFVDVWEGQAFSKSNTDSARAFTNAMIEVNAQWGDMSTKAVNTKNPFRQAELQRGADNLRDLREEMEVVDDASEELAERFGISADAALKFAVAQREADPSIFADGVGKASAALIENYKTSRSGTTATQELAGAMNVLGSETASVEEQVEAFNDTLEALYDQMFGVQDAQDAWQRTLNDLPDVLKAARDEGLNLKDVLSGNSNAAIDVRDHMEDMVGKGLELIASWQEQGVAGDDLAMKIAILSEGWRDQAVKAGLPAPVVDHYLGLLDQIPALTINTIKADDQASGVVANVHRSLSELNGRRVSATVAIEIVEGVHYVPRNEGRGIARWGGVYSFAEGGMTPAHIARGDIIRYAEPETGGEAFIPRFGNRDRSMSILDVAASWYGARVVPMAAGGVMSASVPVSRAAGGHSYVFAPNISVHATPGTDGRRVGQGIVDELTAWSRDNGPLPAPLVG